MSSLCSVVLCHDLFLAIIEDALILVLFLNQDCLGTSLEVQWLGLCTSIAGTRVQSPGWRKPTSTVHVTWPKKKKKRPFNQLNRV